MSPHTDTLVAVLLGAFLATVSGVIANWFETFFHRRHKERSAALLFGEIFSSLRIILQGAAETRTRGDPYGPVTRRMLYGGRRELDLYDRNREALLDLPDPALRAEMHGLMVRIAMPLDGIIDTFRAGEATDPEARGRGFDFMMSNVEKLPAIVERLGRIAHHRFDQYGDVLGAAANTPTPTP